MKSAFKRHFEENEYFYRALPEVLVIILLLIITLVMELHTV
ncbi:hypothetical protein QMZ93_01240 [Pantoea stewartii subsp. indologenes]|nr:hypothetical protein [Pantoea stewartii]MDK2631971.1 hypothetical protein [Pantoea stewartii subsp. indologenes]